jgi:hypothetical protein
MKTYIKVKKNIKYGASNFLIALLLFISASAAKAFGSVWSVATGTTDTTIQINWTALPYGKYKWSGSYPKYKICFKIAGSWVNACNANTITTNSKPYTITGLTPNTSYKIKVYSHTLKKNWRGKWKRPKFRKVGTLIQSTEETLPTEDGTSHTSTVAIVGATDSSLDVQVTYSHPSEFEYIRICYKKRWAWISLNARCKDQDGIVSSWNVSNKKRGWWDVTSVSSLEVTLHPNTDLKKCRQYKVVAYGFPPDIDFGVPIGTHVIGKTSGCNNKWFLSKGMIGEVILNHPQVLNSYVEKVNVLYKNQGMTLFSHLAKQYPNLLSSNIQQVFVKDADGDLNDTFTLFDYLQENQVDVLHAWQKEGQLKKAQLDLETFIEKEFPEVVQLLPQQEFKIANAYVTAVEAFYKGEGSWFKHMAKQHPDLLKAKEIISEDNNYDLSNPRVLFDYLHDERTDIWNMWQIEKNLKEAGLDFDTFIKQNYPEYLEVILAVTLDKFTANAANGKITINWTTGTETNNAGFILWRATPINGQCSTTEASNYKDVRQVKPLVYSKSQDGVLGASYSEDDQSVEAGVTYCYGLEDIDYDGKRTFHIDQIISATLN